MKNFVAVIIIFCTLFFNLSFATDDNISDEFASSNLDKNLKVGKYQKAQIEDELVDKYLSKDLKIKKENSRKNILGETIKISPIKNYSTDDNLKVGEYIDFILVEDKNLNGVFYKKGTNIKARIENISLNQIYGVPADIVLSNFTFDDKVFFDATISKTGANRAIWVYPTTVGLSAILGVGLLFIPIRGGHAKLKKKEVFELEI